MDNSQYETLAQAVETHVIELFVQSLRNVSTFLAYSIGYWLFGMILAWVVERVLRELASNNDHASLLSIPMKTRVCNLIELVYVVLGIYKGLNSIKSVNVDILLFGSGTLPFLLLTWSLRDSFANYTSAWANHSLREGQVIEIMSIKGEIERVGMLQVSVRTAQGVVCNIPQNLFQRGAVCFHNLEGTDKYK